MEKCIKSQKKLRDNVLWIFIVSFFVITCGDILACIIVPEINKEYAFWYTFKEYMVFLSIWFSVMVAILICKENRYMINEIKENEHGNNSRYLIIGLIVGFLLNIISAIIALMNGDISLQFKELNFFALFFLFVAVFVQSSAEEVLCRGFIYQRLLNSTGKPYIAVFLNSLFFAIIHLLNDGMSIVAFYDILITGIFFSLIVYYFDSLWMAMGIHAMWNYTQSILLGLPNSGASFPYSVFVLERNAYQSSFAYNIEFGLEGTILSSMIMTICCVGLYIWEKHNRKLKSKQNNQDIII